MKKFLPTKLFDDDIDPVIEPSEDTSAPIDELALLREKNAELENKILRLHADIANIQRNNAETSRRQSQEGVRRLIDQMLPSIDTLEFALQALPEDIAVHPWTEGLRQFEKLMQKTLSEAGLQKVEIVVGETAFDPQYHEALGQVPSTEELAAGMITQVYQQGYLFQETVLRTAKVQVAN